MRVVEPPDWRMLPYIDAGAHSRLAMDEVGEGKGEVAALGLLPAVERLHKPFSNPAIKEMMI